MTKAKTKAPQGRPTLYTEALATKILEGLSAGTPLAAICRGEDMPDRSTVYEWRKVNADFFQRFARAREDGFDAIAAECLDIAEDGSRDYTTKTRPDGSEYEVFDSEHVQRSKLRIETRLKLLAKWDPKRYGDKVALVGGGEDDSPIKTVKRIERVIIDPANRDT